MNLNETKRNKKWRKTMACLWKMGRKQNTKNSWVIIVLMLQLHKWTTRHQNCLNKTKNTQIDNICRPLSGQWARDKEQDSEISSRENLKGYLQQRFDPDNRPQYRCHDDSKSGGSWQLPDLTRVITFVCACSCVCAFPSAIQFIFPTRNTSL